jgi:hypothetical protein
MKSKLLLLLFFPLLFSCKGKQDLKIERAFYKWDGGSIYGTPAEKLQTLHVKKLYYKFFEVDYSEVRGNFPVDKNQPYGFKATDSIEIVPTVFIRNEIFQFNDEKMLDRLADDIVYLINKYSRNVYQNNDDTFSYKEIQIDCDWTKSTKDKYFYLLKKIKQLSAKELSCTLRLYPYAYPEVMGIPPVDEATLMCYNLIKPLSQNQKNSILDVAELEKYLKRTDRYPLHLDIALPVFFWSQWYQNNRFVQLLSLSSKELASFTKPIEPMWYEVTKDTTLNYETYLKTGDRIKCEEVGVKEIFKAIDLLRKNVKLEGTVTISLFNLSEGTFKQYSDEEIDSVYNRFVQ